MTFYYLKATITSCWIIPVASLIVSVASVLFFSPPTVCFPRSSQSDPSEICEFMAFFCLKIAQWFPILLSVQAQTFLWLTRLRVLRPPPASSPVVLSHHFTHATLAGFMFPKYFFRYPMGGLLHFLWVSFQMLSESLFHFLAGGGALFL